jgi:hypothetical protein
MKRTLTPDARRAAALRRDPGKHRCACGAPAVKYKCGSYACARCDAMELARAGGKSHNSQSYHEHRKPKNRCDCPASYDHTILGHLPDCPTHDT